MPVLGVFAGIAEKSPVGALLTLVLGLTGYLWWKARSARKKREAFQAADEEARRAAAEAAEEVKRAEQALWEYLCSTFGKDSAEKIWAKKLWVGAPYAAVKAMFGDPLDVDEKVMKTRRTLTLKYFPKGTDRYGLRVFIEDDAVAGWEDKRG
ncbi:MAG TPA: hypothetical protein VK550_16370 [Polyangiaceae bacterium]|nr:hypothetical protein [Polyangiaceae bacterium]